jgi:hypothetical protein
VRGVYLLEVPFDCSGGSGALLHCWC